MGRVTELFKLLHFISKVLRILLFIKSVFWSTFQMKN